MRPVLAPLVKSARIYASLRPSVTSCLYGRDRIVVSTSRCGRDNPGSNPGHGRAL